MPGGRGVIKLVAGDGRRIVPRRQALAAMATFGVPWLVPGRALGRGGARPAGERVTVGVIGTGVRGKTDMQGVMRSPLSQVVAVCDCRARRLQAALSAVNAYYAEKTRSGTFQGCRAYADFRDVLAREDIDATLVCVPDHWHGIIATWALRAGKDLYCEKPIGLTIAECKAIRNAVRRYGRVFQTGTQQRSDSRFRLACQLARGGYLGKIRRIEVAVPPGGSIPKQPPAPVPPGFDYDMWTGPAPWHPFDNRRCEWLAMYWIYDYCVGFIANWGVHHLDIAQWGCPEVGREPFELEGTGVLPTEGMCDTIMTWRCQLRYDSGLVLSYTNSRGPFSWQKSQGVTEQCARVLDAVTPDKYHQQGCRFIGDEGWVHVNRQGISAEPASLLKANIPPEKAPLPESSNHYENFLQCVLSRQDPVAPVDAGFRASVLGNVADIALRLGRKVRWDPAAEEFVNDPEANLLQTRAMRAPWHI